MLKEFREFAIKGNVVDMAVGIIIGAAFGKIVDSLVKDVIMPPIGLVLGGGVSNIDRLYERVPRIWAEFVFSDTVVTRLARAVHGDSSGVRGAAWLWGGPPRG